MLRLSIVAFLGCVIALVWYFYGWRAARVVIFPLAFMIFTLPMEWVEDKFGLPAQIFATKHSVAIMRFLGIHIQMMARTGIKILGRAGPVDFSVAAPCSGLKSLVALTAISATYGYVTQKSFGKMVAIMACGPIIAVISNIIRLVAVGVTAQYWGRGPAMAVHDHALPIYILGILLLMAVDKLINSKWLKIEDF
jgi:exosortase